MTGTGGDEEPVAPSSPWGPHDVFLPAHEATPDMFPELTNLSTGMLYEGVVRPLDPALPEYVAIPMCPTK